MSDKAKQEAATVDDSTIQHLGEIPRTPVRKRVKVSDEDQRRRNREAAARWREKQKINKESA